MCLYSIESKGGAVHRQTWRGLRLRVLLHHIYQTLGQKPTVAHQALHCVPCQIPFWQSIALPLVTLIGC